MRDMAAAKNALPIAPPTIYDHDSVRRFFKASLRKQLGLFDNLLAVFQHLGFQQDLWLRLRFELGGRDSKW